MEIAQGSELCAQCDLPTVVLHGRMSGRDGIMMSKCSGLSESSYRRRRRESVTIVGLPAI